MKKTISITLLLLFLSGVASAESLISDFSYIKSINGDTTATGVNTSTNLSYFPIAIHICPHCASGANFDSTEMGHFFGHDDACTASETPWICCTGAGTGACANNTNGKRVQFFASDQSTNLDYEVEFYNAASGTEEAIYWVKVPAVAGNNANSNLVYVAYGNDPNGTDQDDAVNTWSASYKGVAHLSDGTTLSVNDSVSGAGTNHSATASTLQIDGAANFTDTQYISMNTSGISGNVALTISFWMNSSYNSSNLMKMVSMGDGAYVGMNGFYKRFQFTDGTATRYSANNSYVANTLYHIGIVYNGAWMSGTKIYRNGVEISTGTSNDAAASFSNNYTIADGSVYVGKLDEVRVATAARTADWMKLEFYSAKKTNWNGDGWITWNAEDTPEEPPAPSTNKAFWFGS